jgi:hypothetical protein
VKAIDPGGFALKGALRAAIVVPLAFALGEVVIDNPQVGLFAAFGSISLLVFVEFGGSARARLAGYAGVAGAGIVLIPLGTLCSHSTALGAAMMFVVGFGILFAGVLNGYVAAAQSATILVFVLPLMVAADAGEIPARLAGWGIAAVFSTAAVFLIWPRRPRGIVRSGAARAARALADWVEAESADAKQQAHAAAAEAIEKTRRDFVSMLHRPSGTGGRTAALARLVEDLGWIRHYAQAGEEPVSWSPPLEAARAEVERQVPVVLRRAAGQLDGTVPVQAGDAEPLDGLRVSHDRLGRATLARMDELAREGREEEAARELDEVFRLRVLSASAAEIGELARRVFGAPAGTGLGAGIEVARSRLGAARRVARAHATMRSVWLRNSLRGALGLALAVLIGQLADLQHSFWVVLGTLTVLRSSALATSSTILLALLGTFGGIVVGGLIIVGIDDDPTALWILLPFAIGLAAYTPRAVSFAAGQAGFSIVVLILFNLIEPSGWQVGLLRIEDVAIGAGISLLVGLLLWPRGAVTVLRRAFGAAYSSAASLLEASIAGLLSGEEPPPALVREAFASGQLLDGGVRDYLSDRSGAAAPIEDLAVLMAGTARLRQVAELLSNPEVLVRIGPVDPRLGRVEDARRQLEAERDRCCEWFAALGDSLVEHTPPPAPDPPGPAASAVVLERLADAGERDVPPGLAIAWAHRYLAALRNLEKPLARAADS